MGDESELQQLHQNLNALKAGMLTNDYGRIYTTLIEIGRQDHG